MTKKEIGQIKKIIEEKYGQNIDVNTTGAVITGFHFPHESLGEVEKSFLVVEEEGEISFSYHEGLHRIDDGCVNLFRGEQEDFFKKIKEIISNFEILKTTKKVGGKNRKRNG